jgi:hypothetical protein
MPLTVQGVRVTAIISAYNEADIIRQTVADLVHKGIAAHVLDDHSTDRTVEELAALGSKGMVRVETLERQVAGSGGVQEFPWSAVLARKQQLARELDADWFIHHDADEFRESPWGHLNLLEGIGLVDRLGYNAIDFAVLNFWPPHDRFDPAADVREAFQYYEPGGSFDHVQVKCWKKSVDVDLVSRGGHDVQFAGRRVFPLRFILRHYPIRGQAHGTRKVFDERRSRFSAEERQRGWHVQYNAFQPGQPFVRDPGSLRLYDPDEIRARLQIEHRGVEALNGEIAAAGLALREQEEAAARAQAAHAAEIARLSAEVASQQRQFADVSRARNDLEGAYRAVEEKFQGLEESYRALETNARQLERQLVDMKQSWSWKLTAPLRTAWRRQNP